VQKAQAWFLLSVKQLLYLNLWVHQKQAADWPSLYLQTSLLILIELGFCTVSFSRFSITRAGFNFCFRLVFEMRASLTFRVQISKVKKSASSIIKVGAFFMLMFHVFHFWKGTPQPSEGIPQPTHSRHLTGIFSVTTIRLFNIESNLF
jgi:hypothetical protein